MKNKKLCFTLIELLVVIAIISVLMTLVVAGIGYAQEASKIKNAEAFMNRVVASTASFSADAGMFPWPFESSVKTIDPNTNEGDLEKYKEFFSVLSYRDYAGRNNYKDKNKRKKTFLTLEDDFDAKTYKGLKDPWGNYYVIWYDGENFEEVDHTDESLENKKRRMPVSFGILSVGPDGEFDNKNETDYLNFSYWDGVAGDIPSWKKPKNK